MKFQWAQTLRGRKIHVRQEKLAILDLCLVISKSDACGLSNGDLPLTLSDSSHRISPLFLNFYVVFSVFGMGEVAAFKVQYMLITANTIWSRRRANDFTLNEDVKYRMVLKIHVCQPLSRYISTKSAGYTQGGTRTLSNSDIAGDLERPFKVISVTDIYQVSVHTPVETV